MELVGLNNTRILTNYAQKSPLDTEVHECAVDKNLKIFTKLSMIIPGLDEMCISSCDIQNAHIWVQV